METVLPAGTIITIGGERKYLTESTGLNLSEDPPLSVKRIAIRWWKEIQQSAGYDGRLVDEGICNTRTAQEALFAAAIHANANSERNGGGYYIMYYPNNNSFMVEEFNVGFGHVVGMIVFNTEEAAKKTLRHMTTLDWMKYLIIDKN